MADRSAARRAHADACRRRQNAYIDPVTGNFVMTAWYLRERGYCCGAGCRHCPYPPEVQAEAGRPADAECWEARDR